MEESLPPAVRGGLLAGQGEGEGRQQGNRLISGCCKIFDIFPVAEALTGSRGTECAGRFIGAVIL